MKNLIFLIFLIIINQFAFSQTINPSHNSNKDFVKGEIIVKFRESENKLKSTQIKSFRESIISKYSASPIKKFKMGAEHWKIKNGEVRKIIQELRKNNDIEYAEPNFIIKPSELPNDPEFYNQWGLHNTGQNAGITGVDINAEKAWEITKGSPDIVVGILDCGIDYRHEDLKDNIWVNSNEIPDNEIDDDNNGYVDDYYGWDFMNNDNDPMDTYYHGTHVAGIIGAKGDNNIGISGVAWECKMMALKMMEDGNGGTLSAAIEAIEYAKMMGVDITNNSWSLVSNSNWGLSEYSQALFDAINELNDNGILFITSAGNDSRDTDVFPYYPSSYNLDNIISVASLSNTDSISDFSNNGMYSVDIAAPGEHIVSTVLNNGYATFNGTSMAAPMVTGGAILLKALYPNISISELKESILCGISPNFVFMNKVVSSGYLNLLTSLSGLNVKTRIISFGGTALTDTSKSYNIILKNILNENITIDSISAGENFKINKDGISGNWLKDYSISSKSQDSISVVFHPDDLGKVVGEIIIYYHNSLGAFNVKVILIGVGFPAGVVVFDPYFRMAINEKLNRPQEYNPTIEDLSTINDLQIYNSKVTDISGAEYLVNCNSITIIGTRKDEPILHYEGISDLSPLENLENLQSLNLTYNQKISDLSPLATLKNIEYLQLGENYVSDIKPLSNLTKLRSLNLEVNNISDIESISNLSSLENLVLSFNFIHEIEPIGSIKNLSSLGLKNNKITDITTLSELNNLTYLTLSNNPISKYNSLTGLTSLEHLELNNTGISSANFLENMPRIHTLFISNNNIENLQSLANLTELTTLIAENNKINDLSPLSSLKKLSNIQLGINKIDDISPLQGLLNLTHLDLHNYYINQGNYITDISPLANLKALNRLVLSMNPVGNISPIRELDMLTYLDIQWCELNDLSPLTNLNDITHLYLTVNNVSDIYPLVENEGIGSNDILWMGAWFGGNPFSKEAFTEHLPILMERGFLDLTYPENYTKEAPCFPVPERNATEIESDVILRWQTFTEKEISYDVYIGTEPDSLQLFEANLATDSIKFVGESCTRYYWKVVSNVDTLQFYSGLWDFVIDGEYDIIEDFDICLGENYNGWTTSDQYQRTLQTTLGCDSIITTNLNVHELPHPEISFDFDTLSSTGNYLSYQWYDEDGTIEGATSSEYIIEKSGTYYLEVTNENGCSAMSEGVSLIKTNIDEINQNQLNLTVIPNPNNGKFRLRFENENIAKYQVQIINENGQVILNKEVYNIQEEEYNISHLPKGNYFVKVFDGEKSNTKKVIMK